MLELVETASTMAMAMAAAVTASTLEKTQWQESITMLELEAT